MLNGLKHEISIPGFVKVIGHAADPAMPLFGLAGGPGEHQDRDCFGRRIILQALAHIPPRKRRKGDIQNDQIRPVILQEGKCFFAGGRFFDHMSFFQL